MKDEKKTKKQRIDGSAEMGRNADGLEKFVIPHEQEEALRRSDELLRTLIENASDFMTIIDRDGIIRYESPSVERNTGYQVKDLIGKRIFDLIHPDDLIDVTGTLNRVIENPGKTQSTEFRIRDNYGSWRILEAKGRNLLNDPIVKGIVVNSRDVTGQRQAEAQLKESENLYRTLAENSLTGIYMFREGRYLFANEKYSNITGYSWDDLKFMNPVDLIVPEYREQISELVKRRLAGEDVPSDYESQIIRKDGAIRDVHIRATRIMYEGKPSVLGSKIDITERKRAEEALNAQRQRFAILCDRSPVGVMMIAEDGTFEYLNPKFRELFGYDLSDVPNGKTWFRKAYPDPAYRHHVISTWMSDLESFKIGERKNKIYKVTCKDGAGKIVNFMPVQLEAGEHSVLCEDITEQRRAEETLRDSENKHRTLLGNIPQKIFLKDKNSVYVSCNENYARDLRIRPGEIIGKTDYDFYSMELAKKYVADDKRIIESGKTEDIEEKYLQDGQQVVVHTVKTPVKDEKGEISGILGIFWDITEHKRAQEALLESEQRLKIILQGSPIPTFVIDRDHKVVHWNKAMEELSGVKAEEAIGTKRPWKPFYGSRERPSMADLLVDELIEEIPQWYPGKHKKSELIEEAYEATDFFHLLAGGGKWLHFTAATIRDFSGTVVGAVETLEDITEQKLAEKALRESEDKLRNLIETSSDWLWEINERGVYTYVSPKVRDLLGYEPEEILGKTPFELRSLEEADLVKDVFAFTMTKREPFKCVESRNLHKDGHLVVLETSGVPFFDPNGTFGGYRGIDRDITERKQVEEALRRSEETARRLAQENAIVAQIGRIINSTLNIEEVYDRFAEEARKLIPFDGIAINVIHHEGGTVAVPYAAGIDVPACQPGDVLSLAGSVTGEVMRRRSGLIVEAGDREKLRRLFPTLSGAFEVGLRSLMAVPLISKDQVIGAIHFRSLKPYAYSGQDLKLGESIGSQIAGAVANAQLYAERKRAEEALRTSEEKYRLVVENAKEAIFVAQDGMLKFTNEAAEERSGYSSEELTSRPFIDLVHPDDQEMVLRNHQKRLRGGEVPAVYPFRIVDKQGNTKWVEASAVVITWEGRPATLNFLSDITGRKRADNLIHTQHNLMLALSAATELDEGLRLCVDAALEVSEMDNGGVYLLNETSGALDLVFQKGLQTDFVSHVLHYDADSANVRLLMAGEPIYTDCDKLGFPLDGSGRYPSLRAIAILPIRHEDRVIGCLIVASHTLEEVPSFSRVALEAIAAQIGSSITRLKAEEALKTSEEKYRTLVESSTDAILMIDKERKIVSFNQAFLHLFGYDKNEIEGKSIRIIHPSDESFNAFGDLAYPAIDRIGFLRTEWDFVRKDGMAFPVETVTSGIKSPHGLTIGFVAVIRDITERKRAEEALKESEEKYRNILENIEDGYYEADLAGRFTFFNDSFCRMLGYTKDELVGMNDRNVTDQENAEKVYKVFNKVYKTGEPAKGFGWEIIRKDRTKRFIEASASLIRDSEGRPIGFRGVVRDITERKQAEKALWESEHKLRTILQGSPIPTFVITKDHKVMYWNKALEEMSGIKTEEIMGTNQHWKAFYSEKRPCMADLLVDGEIDVIPQWYEGKYTKSKLIEGAYEATDFFPALGEGGRWLRFTAAIIRDSIGNLIGVLETLEDVTERKRVEEALRQSEQRKTILNQIASIFLTIPDEEMYGEVLAVVLQMMKSKFGIFGFVGDNGDLIMPSLTREIWSECQVPGKSIVFPSGTWGESLWGRSIREKKAFYSRGPFRTPEGHIHIDNFLTVPIVFGKETIGLLSVANKEGGYTEGDEELQESIANFISPILSARLQRDRQERERNRAEETLQRSEKKAKRLAQENAIMAEIGRIISSTLNIEEVYERFVEEARKLISFDRISVNIINPEENTVTPAYVSGEKVLNRQIGDVFPLAGSFTEEVMRTRSGLLLQTEEDIEKKKSWFPSLLTTFQVGIRSMISVPLISKDQVIGALHIQSLTPDAYTEADLNLAEKVGAQIAGAIANAQLFIDRKRAEEALRESEEKYRNILESIEDGYYEVDLPGNFTFFNDSLCRSLGYSREELVGMNDRQYTDPENVEKLYREFNKVYRTGKASKVFDWEIIRKDGTKRNVEASVSLIKDPGGHRIGFRGIVRDVAERKHAENMLRESEARFRNLVENSLTGIYIIQEGQIAYENSEQDRIFGPLPRPSNFNNFENVHPEDVEKVKEAYEKILSGQIHSFDIDMRFFASGKVDSGADIKWVHSRSSVIQYQGKEAILVNMMDVTRTMELEHLARINDRMTSLGRIAAGIIHELRNPLSGINVYLTTLKKIYDSPESLKLENLEKVEKILGKLQSASNKIESVIKRVMDFSKPTVPRLSLTSINAPIEEAINLCLVTCQKSGVKIEKSLCEDLPPCYSDPPLIEQVLLNLITNAAQAMKNQEGEKIIEITSAMESNRVVIRVADSGPGIPLMLRKKIFDPFFTTKKDGSGIGLSLCQRIICDHGGSLDIFTSKWGGSEFTIEIPIEKRTNIQ